MAGRMRGNPFKLRSSSHKLSSWRLSCNSSLSCFPFYFSLISISVFMGERYFIPSGTSSMPVFQVVTLWGVAWAVTLLLEMLGACSWPCCWKLSPSDVYLQIVPAHWGCGGIQVTKHSKGPEGSCFQSCVCKSGLFCWLGLQSSWAI